MRSKSRQVGDYRHVNQWSLLPIMINGSRFDNTDGCVRVRDVSVSRSVFEMYLSRLKHFVGTSCLGLVSDTKSNVSVSSRSHP